MHFVGFIIFKLIFITFIITAFVIIMRKRKFFQHSASDPITILETRFVQGEITSEEFKRIKEELIRSRK
jgi:uncharacterized membrane protein